MDQWWTAHAEPDGLILRDRVLSSGVDPDRLDQRRIRRRDLHFHGRTLALGDVQVHGGVALTSVARTVFDLCAYLPRLEAVWCADDALRRGLVTAGDLTLAGRRRLGGRGDAVAAIRIAAADGLAESILETAGRLFLADGGLPLPVAQLEVRDACGQPIARLDGGYPELKLAIEFDGRSVHSATEAVFRDRRRQNALESAGWRVLRFTWWDVVHDTPRFVATVRAALLRASA